MSHYVIGDIHGCFDEFIALTNRIDSIDQAARYILVGDIIDRGPQSMEMLNWAMEHCNKPDEKYTLLLGNHEYMKISYLKKYLSLRKTEQIDNLSAYEPERYSFERVLIENNVSDERIMQMLKFFSTLPVFWEKTYNKDGKKTHYIVVHGDIPWYCLNKNETFRKRSLSQVYMPVEREGYGRSVIEEIIWGRNYDGHPELRKTTIVHGHTPTTFLEDAGELQYKGRICYRPGDINVDCGMVLKKYGERYANLAALRLDDLQELYFYI